MSKRTIIYGIIDPRTAECRYVGKTTQELKFRIRQHTSAATKGRVQHVYRWLRQLITVGVEPEYVIFEEAYDDWEEAERFWISYLKGAGARLTNHTAGGDGVISMVHSAESREKMSKSQKGRKHSQETKDKIRDASSKYKHTEETKQKLSAIVTDRATPAYREKLSCAQKLSHKNNPDQLVMLQERCAKMSANNIGRKMSEENRRKVSERFLGKPGLAFGEGSGVSKLTDEKVLSIRSLYAAGGTTYKKLGMLFGVTDVNIMHIVRGKSWKHLLPQTGLPVAA